MDRWVTPSSSAGPSSFCNVIMRAPLGGETATEEVCLVARAIGRGGGRIAPARTLSARNGRRSGDERADPLGREPDESLRVGLVGGRLEDHGGGSGLGQFHDGVGHGPGVTGDAEPGGRVPRPLLLRAQPLPRAGAGRDMEVDGDRVRPAPAGRRAPLGHQRAGAAHPVGRHGGVEDGAVGGPDLGGGGGGTSAWAS